MIGIALGGGGGLGWAHIGILKALDSRFGIKPSFVAGTSIGSIVGGGYAAGLLVDVEEVASSFNLWNMLSLSELGFGKGAMIGSGKIADALEKHFGHRLIEDLPIPYAAVSADLYTAERYVHLTGSLVAAMRASSAIPAVFPAVPTRSRLLVDGGLVDPIPVEACRALGASKIIAVNLQDDYPGALGRIGIDPEGQGKGPNAFKVGRAALVGGFKTIARKSLTLSQPDVELAPRVGHLDPGDFTNAEELIKIGEDCVDQHSSIIHALLDEPIG